ncbi:vacuolar fusion protein CCZ1 homolog isoform X2 [Wolffia australiana]
MGLSSGTIVNDGIQLCVFDLTRGQQEEAPCEAIETERHTHVFYQAEPDIWMVLIVDKIKDSDHVWRCDGLEAILKEVYSLFVMFYGPLRSLLDEQPTGDLARSHLHSFVTDYLSDFHLGKKFQLPSFRECLGEQGNIQMLSVEREVGIEVQSLVAVLESCAGRNCMCSSLVLFQNLLVSSTLTPDDTLTMFTYGVKRLTPQALVEGTSSWSYIRRGPSSSSSVTSLNAQSAASSLSEVHGRTSNNSIQGNNHDIPRALHRGKWSKGNDGFLLTDIWLTEARSSITSNPVIWLRQAGKRMFLIAFQHKKLTIVLLIPVDSLINGESDLSIVRTQVLENAKQRIIRVEQKLSEGWPGENANHVKGYRYLLLDTDQKISKASPPGKVSTLTKDSLLSLNKLRKEVDLEKKRMERSNPKLEKDLEVCVRARNNAWIIARMSRGKELYIVLDKSNETILFASDAVEKFSDRQCDGAFSLD